MVGLLKLFLPSIFELSEVTSFEITYNCQIQDKQLNILRFILMCLKLLCMRLKASSIYRLSSSNWVKVVTSSFLLTLVIACHRISMLM